MTVILNAIREETADGDRRLGLAYWLEDHGREDEATAVRVLWPTLRDNLACTSLAATLADVARNAKMLAAVARKVEQQVDETPPA